MANWLTPENILFLIGVLGSIFTVYNYIRNPQIANDRKDALLTQQLQFMNEATERRFQDVNSRMTEVLAMAQNHIHTVDTKVDALNTNVASIGIQVATLGTIIEERIPKKQSNGRD